MPTTTEIGKRADFSQLRYAQCWEDADLLLRALIPAPHHRLLSIASAGDNTLALLAQGVQRVVAVDLSVAQIAALELRVAAYRQLDYPSAMQLLGVHEQSGAQRLDLYAACRPSLSPASQNFWDAHADDIQAGVTTQGRFERYLRTFSQRILPLIHSTQVRDALLQRRNLIGRCKFYTQEWDTWRWRWAFRIFFSRAVMGRLGRAPAFFRYSEGNVATSVLHLTRDALTDSSIPIEHLPGEAPNTLVVGRNGLMARLAAIHAHHLGAGSIVMGVMELEGANSGYRDCSRAYMDKMQEILRLDLDNPHFTIRTPLVKMTKRETMELADSLGVLEYLLENTISCYEGLFGRGCGRCPACLLRNEGIDAFYGTKV